MKKVGFVSLGCPKNLVDSEVMMGQLKEAGYEITNNADEAETVVVNTCGFIESAKQESIDAILEAADQTKNFRELPLLPIGNKSATYLYDFDTPRYRATDSYTAFIKIAEGCDRPCAFCSIPSMRGSFRSRRFGSILKEAEDLARAGVKEIVLIAQDSSRFGEDLGEVDALAKLIRALGEIEDLEWIRVMYAYPTHISDAFLAAINETPKAVKYLDMPLQHGSRNVLKLMKRGGTRESLEKLIRRVREKVPGITIRTTFITGFPGETEADFEELMTFVRNCEFDNVGVFTYSDEEGTPAFALEPKVDAKTMKSRRTRLMKEQAKISKLKNKAKIGKTFPVLLKVFRKNRICCFRGALRVRPKRLTAIF